MSKIKLKFKNLEKSSTLAINELSNSLQKKGKKIYKFGLGQSPFPVPKIIIQELKISNFIMMIKL